MRGLAVLGMIWTHACNTFLRADLLSSAFFQELTYWHGLVAPAFLYLAGYNRGLSALRPGAPKPAWPTVKRLLWIWLIGYLLHAPWGALAKGEISEEALRTLFQVDVLHCLAVSCLVLLAFERLGSRVASILAAVSIVCVLKWSFEVHHTGWHFIDAYLGYEHGSLFPVLPWFGFAAWGFMVALLPVSLWRRAALGASLCLGLPWLSEHVTSVYIPQVFFLERIGWVMLIAAAFSAMWGKVEGRWTAWLTYSGQQSLVMYVAHLLFIHAIPVAWGQTLQGVWQQQLAWPGVVGSFGLLMALSWLVAWALGHLATSRARS
jgi:hypothetical protein